MNKELHKAKGLCPFGCCTNGLSKAKVNRIVRHKNKAQLRKEWK